MGPIRRFIEDEAGVVAVTVALLAIVFVGFAALVVDVGYAYTLRRQLQAAADAGALAGVKELLREGSAPSEVLAVAEGYVLRNASSPAGSVRMSRAQPGTLVGPDFVRVTVEQDSTLLFGGVFSARAPKVRAVAEAKAAYVTGLRRLSPIGLPIVRAQRVEARVGAGAWVPLAADGTGWWAGPVVVPALPANTSRIVDLRLVNSQGWAEGYPGVSVVHALASGHPVRFVDLSAPVVTNGPTGRTPGTVVISVETTGTTEIEFNGASSKGMGTRSVSFASPAASELRATFDIDVLIDKNETPMPSLEPAAVVNSVRATHPLEAVQVSPRFLTPGQTSSVTVRVRVRDYRFGELYQLKVSSGSEAGNFGPVTFAGGGAAAFAEHLRYGYPGVVRIGQEIDSETGNMNSSGVRAAYDYRESGPSFSAWVAAGMPRSSPSLIYVPVVEKFEKAAGRHALRVVSFAAFYVEDYSQSSAELSGRFVEYVLPSEFYQDQKPPTGMYVETVRLVTPATER